MTRLTKSGRTYKIDGRRVPSVTTIIGVLDKPALVDWAARESAAFAINHWTELAKQPISVRQERIQKARFDSNKKAIGKGNDLHAMAQQLIAGQATPPEEYRTIVEKLADWLDVWRIEEWHTERPVANLDYLYGGQFDLIGWSDRLGSILLDWKTGAGVWPEVALQLAGYRNANILLTEAGDEIPMPDVDGCYVAHILADAVELIPVRAGDAEWQSFLYARELWEWKESLKTSSDSYDNPVGEPMFPEQVTA